MAATSTSPDPAGSARPQVEMRVPADGAYASVLRTTAAGLAARLDFTIEDIDDLRIAVSEACAMVLDDAAPAADLVCAFTLVPGSVTVTVGVTASTSPEPDYDSFSWQVLTTLAHEAEVVREGGRFALRLTLRSAVAVTGT